MSVMRLDIADMRLFVCIADAGSITGGARRANLALASASERLKNIELDAGVSLLVRHPRGIGLTDAGQIFAQRARLILTQREQLKAELAAFVNGSRGKLNCMPIRQPSPNFCRQGSANGFPNTPVWLLNLKNEPALILCILSLPASQRRAWSPTRLMPRILR